MEIRGVVDPPSPGALSESELAASRRRVGGNSLQQGTIGPSLRLSPKNVRVILVGLNWIWQHHQLSLAGRTPRAKPDLRWRPDLLAKGRFQPWLMNVILSLRTKLTDKYADGGRLYRLKTVEVSTMMLAVRVAGQLQRQGIVRERKDFQRRVRKLLNRLEKLRKRAKRCMIREQGIEAYRREASEWQSFVCWIRLRFLQFQRVAHCPLGYRKALLTTFVKWTRSELAARDVQIPEEQQLRRMVRRMLRYVRRDRRDYRVAMLKRDRNLAAREFASFVIAQIKKETVDGHRHQEGEPRES